MTCTPYLKEPKLLDTPLVPMSLVASVNCCSTRFKYHFLELP